jgi:hypothetical protein
METVVDISELDNLPCSVAQPFGLCGQAGILDTRDACWEFFIEKVRKYLHVVLCFSPVGDKFRIRARQFPALINNTVIDWFQPWPQEALVSVAGEQQSRSNLPSIIRESLNERGNIVSGFRDRLYGDLAI